MISADFMAELEKVRTTLTGAFQQLRHIDSFNALCSQSTQAKDDIQLLASSIHPRLKRVFEDKFVVAIVGNSSAGKTSIMDEIFPALSARGWLVTETSDTTSQSLRVEYGKAGDSGVVVHSWTAPQLKDFCSYRDVPEENERDNIKVRYEQNKVIFDGTESNLKNEKCRFSLTQELIPFSAPYQVPTEKLEDKKFIHALTIKDTVKELNADSVLVESSNAYNSLQLRAVVKDVTLKDNFKQIQQWTGINEQELAQLVFVDTPGIAVKGSNKDEVLKHALGPKSNFIALELLKNDELDVLVHLVLCGTQTGFETVWKDLEKVSDAETMRDLTSRLILAINGTNIFLENKDIKKRQKDLTLFDTTIDDNILQKMSPRGRIKPARLCFMDCKSVVESMGIMGSRYDKKYQQYKPLMEAWVETKNSPTHRLLEDLGAVEDFRKNIEALVSPDDRGQGFLMRQVVSLLKADGHKILLKKYVRRTQLSKHYTSLLSLLSRYYSDDGSFNGTAAREALSTCLGFLDKNDLMAIEHFCVEMMDPHLQDVVQGAGSRAGWLKEAFATACRLLGNKLLEAAAASGRMASDESAAILENVITVQTPQWSRYWGYDDADLPAPAESNNRTLIIAKHCIATHMREILTVLTNEDELPGGMQQLEQTEEDKEQVKTLIDQLKAHQNNVQRLCEQHGVAI